MLHMCMGIEIRNSTEVQCVHANKPIQVIMVLDVEQSAMLHQLLGLIS